MMLMSSRRFLSPWVGNFGAPLKGGMEGGRNGGREREEFRIK